MSSFISIAIPVTKVVGKGRPRARFDKRTGKRRFYTPEATVRAEEQIRNRFLFAIGDARADYTGPFELHLEIHRALPASAPNSRIGEADTGKPDADTVATLVLDALSVVASKADQQCVAITAYNAPRPQ